MSIKQRFHGIELAANSVFANLTLEELAVAPNPLVANRAWINTAGAVPLINYTLDISGTVTVFAVSSAADLAAAESSFESSLSTLETTLRAEIATAANGGGTALTAEIDRALAAESAEAATRLAADNAEATARAAADTAEATARAAADTAETTARIAGDNAAQAAIAAETTARTLAIAGINESITTAISDESAIRVSAEETIAANAASQLATETAARLAGDAAGDTAVAGVQAEIDAIEDAVGLNSDGTFTAPEETVYLGAVTSIAGGLVALDTAVSEEAAARTAADVTQTAALAAETQSRIDGDTALATTLQAYIDSAVTNNTNADNAETVARVAADAAIQAELNLTQASLGVAADGSFVDFEGTNYLDTATTVVNASVLLDTQVKANAVAIAAETTARTTADSAFTTALNAEAATRTAADTAQQQEIDTIEAGAGLETDGTYAASEGSNYLELATSLKDADLKLDSALKAATDIAVTLRDTTVPAVVTSVTAEATRALAAEAALAASIAALNSSNAAVDGVIDAVSEAFFVYDSTDASVEGNPRAAQLTHTVVHNLDSDFVTFTVMVQGEDSVYRNDSVNVEATDSNTLTVFLSVSAFARVVVVRPPVFAA